ncbi:MAG: hypothetical protein F6J87_15110 [Spirulina sp. SIO3F2]|nr:hypothetical protein [Spirulina sp. SIO3F2]
MNISFPRRTVALSLTLLGAMLWQTASQLQPVAAQETEQEEEDVVVESTDNPRFSCQFLNSEHTVAYSPVEQPNQNYAWASPRELGGGWTAERRCTEISRRLEEYRPDGLVELRAGVENGYDVICVTTEDDPSCRIVFTVPPGQDPIATRDAVFDNLTLADSGQNTQGVPTLREGDLDILGDIGDVLGVELPTGGNSRNSGSSTRSLTGINLRPFLAPSDRGTGEHLNLSNGRAFPTNNPPATRPTTPAPSGSTSGDLSF